MPANLPGWHARCVQRGQRTDTTSPLAGVAVLITLVGGSVLLVGYFTDLSVSIALPAAGLWILGLILVSSLAIRSAREEGRSFLGALWSMLRTTGRWIWEFMP